MVYGTAIRLVLFISVLGVIISEQDVCFVGESDDVVIYVCD